VRNRQERHDTALSLENVDKIMSLLNSDSVFIMDGGGKRKAALLPIYTANNIKRFYQGILQEIPNNISYKLVIVNNQPGILALVGDEIYGVYSFTIEDKKISKIYFIVNPDKMKHIIGI